MSSKKAQRDIADITISLAAMQRKRQYAQRVSQEALQCLECRVLDNQTPSHSRSFRSSSKEVSTQRRRGGRNDSDNEVFD